MMLLALHWQHWSFLLFSGNTRIIQALIPVSSFLVLNFVFPPSYSPATLYYENSLQTKHSPHTSILQCLKGGFLAIQRFSSPKYSSPVCHNSYPFTNLFLFLPFSTLTLTLKNGKTAERFKKNLQRIPQ